MSESQNFGEYFKQRREERGLSLKEVENATSIRSSYLEAIEQGQFHLVISPVYAKGFVRHYAAFLGIDGDRFIDEFSHLFGKKIEKMDEVLGIGTLESRNPQYPVKSVPRYALALATALMLATALCLAIFFELL